MNFLGRNIFQKQNYKLKMIFYQGLQQPRHAWWNSWKFGSRRRCLRWDTGHSIFHCTLTTRDLHFHFRAVAHRAFQSTSIRPGEAEFRCRKSVLDYTLPCVTTCGSLHVALSLHISTHYMRSLHERQMSASGKFIFSSFTTHPLTHYTLPTRPRGRWNGPHYTPVSLHAALHAPYTSKFTTRSLHAHYTPTFHYMRSITTRGPECAVNLFEFMIRRYFAWRLAYYMWI